MLFALLSIKNCYAEYDDNGCSTCIHRFANDSDSTCGWCANIQSCVEGDIDGPYNSECSLIEWLFNKTLCDDAFCARFENKRDCKEPCKWSYRKEQCILVKYFEYTDYLSTLNIFIAVSLVVLGVFLLSVTIYHFCPRHRKDVGDYEIWENASL